MEIIKSFVVLIAIVLREHGNNLMDKINELGPVEKFDTAEEAAKYVVKVIKFGTDIGCNAYEFFSGTVFSTRY